MITFEIKSEEEIDFKYSCYYYHRRGRKAYRSWYPNGQKMSEHHYINGIFQSFKRWNKQGKLL